MMGYYYIPEMSDVKKNIYVIKDSSDGSYEEYTKEELLDEIARGVTYINLPPSVVNKNGHLGKARENADDEFYTMLSDIEVEMEGYDPSLFYDKTIYLPADVAYQHGRIPRSEFVHYFQMNVDKLKFKRLIATCLSEKVDNEAEAYNHYEMVRNDDGTYREEYSHLAPDGGFATFGLGYDSGDFRSKECTELLKQSDIVVTNPPFSLFREFFKWLIDESGVLKPCILVGDLNAVGYKAVAPYIVSDELREGYSNSSRKSWGFMRPNVDSDGIKDELATLTSVTFYTNMPNNRVTHPLQLSEHYYEDDGVTPLPNVELKYPKYEYYDLIDVGKISDIPVDYFGAMAVPITFLHKHCKEQFKIIGVTGVGAYSIHDCVLETGVEPYKRLVIKRVVSGGKE